jgi:hypothetical protein
VGRSIERTWIFIKKIVSIVAAVSVIVFALLQFPGLSDERVAEYDSRWTKAEEAFRAKIGPDNATNPSWPETVWSSTCFLPKRIVRPPWGCPTRPRPMR